MQAQERIQSSTSKTAHGRGKKVVGSAFLALFLVARAPAQGVYYSWQTQFGQGDVAPAGDVDGDGVQDFAVGEAGVESTGVHGLVHIRSGATARPPRGDARGPPPGPGRARLARHDRTPPRAPRSQHAQ